MPIKCIDCTAGRGDLLIFRRSACTYVSDSVFCETDLLGFLARALIVMDQIAQRLIPLGLLEVDSYLLSTGLYHIKNIPSFGVALDLRGEIGSKQYVIYHSKYCRNEYFSFLYSYVADIYSFCPMLNKILEQVGIIFFLISDNKFEENTTFRVQLTSHFNGNRTFHIHYAFLVHLAYLLLSVI